MITRTLTAALLAASLLAVGGAAHAAEPDLKGKGIIDIAGKAKG